jgi:hypothetical protein
MMSAVQNTVPKSQQGSEPSSDGKHEMQGPGFDISSLMGNIMMPPTPPMNTTSIPAQEPVVLDDDDDDDISDIAEAPTPGDVEEGGDGELREVKVTQTKAKRGRKKKSVEINL